MTADASQATCQKQNTNWHSQEVLDAIRQIVREELRAAHAISLSEPCGPMTNGSLVDRLPSMTSIQDAAGALQNMIDRELLGIDPPDLIAKPEVSESDIHPYLGVLPRPQSEYWKG